MVSSNINNMGVKIMGATVSAGYAKAMFDFAVLKGAASNLLLAQSNIELEAMNDQDARIDMGDYISLVLTAKALTDNPALVLHFCEATNLASFTIVGLICHSASTMGEALMQLNRYGQLVAEVDLGMDGNRFVLKSGVDGLWLEDMRINPNEFYELTEAAFGRFSCEFNRHFKDQPFIKAVYITHKKPSYADEYSRIFNVPIHFNSNKNALLIDPSWLKVEIEPSKAYMFGILAKKADDLLDELHTAKTLKGKVEAHLLPILHTGEIGMPLIADKMGITRQTLYRKLKLEGSNFEKIIDQLRHKMAMHYLNGQKVSINETAYLVGFSDASAFSHAFKRWTGISPSKRN